MASSVMVFRMFLSSPGSVCGASNGSLLSVEKDTYTVGGIPEKKLHETFCTPAISRIVYAKQNYVSSTYLVRM